MQSILDWYIEQVKQEAWDNLPGLIINLAVIAGTLVYCLFVKDEPKRVRMKDEKPANQG